MAYFAVQPVVYLVAWILLHVKGARENRAFIYPLYAIESMLLNKQQAEQQSMPFSPLHYIFVFYKLIILSSI